MQTTEQILLKVDDLLSDSVKEMKKHIKQVLKSGCINLNDYENDWLLPKLLVNAAYGKMQAKVEPPKNNRKMRKELKNIKVHI